MIAAATGETKTNSSSKVGSRKASVVKRPSVEVRDQKYEEDMEMIENELMLREV